MSQGACDSKAPPPSYNDVANLPGQLDGVPPLCQHLGSFEGDVGSNYDDVAGHTDSHALFRAVSPVTLTEPPVHLVQPLENVAPPTYNEVLAAEGTGRFSVIESRTRGILNFYQTRMETNENSLDTEEFSPDCSGRALGKFYLVENCKLFFY